MWVTQQKPNGKPVVLPVCLTRVPVALLILQAIRERLHTYRMRDSMCLERLTMEAGPTAKPHYFYATAICVADNHAAHGFSSPSEVTVS